MQALFRFGPRVGFVLLLAALAAFAALFVGEERAARAALDTERALRTERSAQALDEQLLGALAAAETRLEVLETLPLVEEDGLLLFTGELQRFPRLAAAAGDGGITGDELQQVLAGLTSAGLAPPRQQDARARLTNLEPVPLPPANGAPAALPALSPLPRLVLVASLLEARPHTQALAAQVGEGVSGALGHREDGLQALVLRAWPWLPTDAAARWCLRVRRLGEQVGAPTERFTAACQRALAAQPVPYVAVTTPALRAGWLRVKRGDTQRGVQIDLADVVHTLDQTLHQRGVLEPGETVAPRVPGDASAGRGGGADSTGPAAQAGRASTADTAPTRPEENSAAVGSASSAHLVALAVHSPRLDAAAAAVRATLRWKLGLLGVTALLGLGVVLLARVAARREAQVLAAQRDFIGTFSHELRTPLAAIRLLAETLERKLGGAGPGKDYPRRLVSAADGLSFVVENILSFNRVASGRWQPRRAPFAFVSLETLLRDDAALAVDAQVELHFEGLAALAPLPLDPECMRVVVQNLLRNAWKYGQRQPVRFAVVGHETGSEVVLTFTDNGPGIPEGQWEAVFAPFFRLPPLDGRAIGGSGLGLALARRLAELQGGRLTLAASSNEGTTFELRFPRSAP